MECLDGSLSLPIGLLYGGAAGLLTSFQVSHPLLPLKATSSLLSRVTCAHVKMAHKRPVPKSEPLKAIQKSNYGQR
jgi:hypothetical protein